MLSYQHLYHAGNQADVHKHASLAVLLTKMAQKDKPMTYLESHAGRGVYDLSAPEAVKTGEAAAGIEAFLKSGKAPADHPYIALLNRIRGEISPTVYPGSPFIAEALLRPTDSIHLMELHPREYQALYGLMRYPNTHLHHRDGFEGVLALCPPQPSRGLVFTDPSYEDKTDYAATARFVLKLHRKWATGVIAVWYPLLKGDPHLELTKALTEAGLPKLFRSEVLFEKPATALAGSGLIVVNTPFGTEDALRAVKNWL